MARMADNDMKSSTHQFSTPLNGNPCARVGLDKQQEFTNKLNKEIMTQITKPFVGNLAALITAREHDLHEIWRDFLVTSGNEDPATDILRKRRDSVKAAVPVLVEGVAFTRQGEAQLMSPDGREAHLTEAEEIPGQDKSCCETWRTSSTRYFECHQQRSVRKRR